MSTEATAALPVGAPRGRAGLYGDEQGAILVLGIFMCACMVGALWYLAGIGDAIMYRERMQEGADAVAFSGAVLHARGMNLIVLLNLIMALILAIRVALKAIYLGLMIIATLLSLIPVVGAGLAAPFFTAPNVTNGIINATRQPINQSIRLLSRAQTAIARVVPPASLVGSFQVGTRYKPIVENSVAGSPTTVGNGLPVQNDTPAHLCQKAGEAVGTILGSLVPIPGLGSGLGSVVGKLAKAGGFYFCEIGAGGSAPNLGEGAGAASQEGCNEQRNQLQQQANDARKAYDDQCAAYKCNDSGTTLTADQQATLGRLAAQRDAAQSSVDNFNQDRCMRNNRQQANRVIQREMSQSQGGSGDGMNPKRIRDQNPPWKNGIKDAQIVAVATGNMNMLRAGTTGAKAGAWRTNIRMDPPPEARFAIAQAEFFFDCRGAWEGSGCNGRIAESHSMWKLRWRARLRRFNNPFVNDGTLNVSDILAGRRLYTEILSAPSAITISPQNAALLLEVGRIATERELIIH